MSDEHHLNLLENSISYFREAATYAQTGSNETAQWKFAIINLVQAIELAVKESLFRIHPIFIYENIDNPKHTVSITNALKRLTSSGIGNTNLSEHELKKINSAVKLRNELTHYECRYEHSEAEAKFAGVFAFMIFYYKQYLGLEVNDILTEDLYADILEMIKVRKELLHKATEYIKNNNFIQVWECPECQEETFIVEKEECCLCQHKESIVPCPNCGNEVLAYELEDITELFDSDYSEGRIFIHDNYGYAHEHACFQCIDKVKEDILNKKHNKYYEEMNLAGAN